MLLSQVFSPFAYAVTGEETPVPEAVVEEPITPEEDNGDEVETSIWETLSEEESQQEKQQEPETITQDVVVVNSWDYQWTDWEKIQNGSWNLENNHESATVVIDSWTIVDDMSCDIIELSWWNENIEEKYDEKTENLTWIDSNSWIMETIKNFLWLWESKEEEKEQKNYEYESQVITWEAEYDDVKVEVYADTWLFYSWTELLIQAVTGDMYEWVKEVLSWQLESISEEEQTVVAFDISFIYSWEEVQPLTWRVQVKFNYENNEDFKAAEEDEEREVKVYHLNDKDGEWNKIEELTWTTIEEVIINEEKSEEENVLVVEAESFSVYTIVKQVIEEQLISFQYWMISIANPLNPSQWITIMDRNLWATITWAWNNAPKESYGYHYQWWNNYWFDSNESSTEISTSSSTIDVSELSEYYGSTFIVWNTSWMSSFKNLWWEWWQWPCPEWRHVPKYTERESLVSYYNNTYTNSWVNGFTSYFKLPYAWYREHSYWWFSNAARKFWTSQKSPSNNQRARIFYLYNDSEIRTTYINDMAYWYSIRCFKNNYESIGEDDLYNEVSFVLNWWKWSVMQTMILSWELLVRPADPVREYRIFSGWYLSWENVEFDFLSRNITENITLYAKWKCVEWYESYGDSCKRISNWKTAILKKWSDFNKIIKSLAKWYDVTSEWTSDVLITKILREEEKKQWENTIISVENSEYPVYVWYENWAIKYFSEAWTIYMNEDSSDMFTYLEKLRTISFEDFDTSKVTNMRRMFYLCKDLLKLNLESFDMSKVTNMADMFRWCSKLESLDIWWWDTSSVTNFSWMFYGCSKLESLDLWWWNTNSATDMSFMFDWCSSLKSLDIWWWDTSSVTSFSWMFYGCSKLESLDIWWWDTSSVIDMAVMFNWCSSLKSLDIWWWDTSKVESMSSMFNWCSSLKSLDIWWWDTSEVTNMEDMFKWCSNLENLDIWWWDTSKVTNMEDMFYGCSKLESLDIWWWDTSKVTTMEGMFYGCSKLESLDIWWWDTNNVTSMNSMFNWCNSLKSLDIWWFDTSSVTDMSSMFQWCNSLTGLDLSSFVTTNVYYLNSMFYDASLLEKIYVSDRFRITNNLYSSYSMFYWATSIVWWRWTTYNWSYTDKQYAIIDEWPENPWYFTRKWWVIATLLPWQEFNAIIKTLANGNSVSYSSIDYEIEKITTWSLSQMENIDSDKKVRLSTISSEVPVYWWFDNSSKTLYYYSEADTIDMNPNSSYMFSYLAWLKTIDFDRIKTSSVGNMENMFFYSTSLKYLDLSNFDTSSVKNMNSMFRWCSNLESLNLDWWNLKLLQSASNWNWFFKETPKLKRVSMRGWEIPSSFNDWISRTWWASTIEEVDVTDWDLSRTKNISWLFWSSTNLKRIIWLNTWDISRITSMSYLFQWCSNLESLNMDWWNFKWFSYLNNISGVFDGATKLSSLSCKRWKLPKNSSSWLTSWYWTNIQTIDVTDWNLSNTEDISSLFYLSNATQIVWLNTWDISNIKSMNYMFENMRNLKSIDLSNWNMKNLQTMYSLFNWCINLEIVKLDWWNFKNVQGYSQMFYDTPKLKVIQSSWWQLPNSFSNWLCRNGSASSVEIVDVTNWNLSWTNNIDGLFADCQNLTGLIWFETRKNTNNLVTIGSMFQNTKLEEIDFWNFDSSNIVNMYWLFFKSDRLRTIKIGKLNTQNVKNMSKMFYWLESLVSLDLSSFDTSNVVEMNEMFKWSNKLKTIYVSSSFKTDKVMSSSDMFSWTLSLIWWNWTRYDLNHIDVEYARIDSWDSLWYFTNPNRLSVRFITTTWVELLKQWISTWSTVDNLKDGHRIYRYYISSDLQTWFDFTKPLYWYTEIYVTRDDVKYVTYDYWTWVKKFSIYTWSCVVENWEDKSQESESCEVDLPGIYVLTWYHTPMWYKKWTEITYTNDKITLTWDEELEAKAIANHYTISYNSWTWTWEMESQEFVYDEEWILNENRFEKAGYYFTEWIDENWNTYKNKEKILNLLTTWSIELTVQRSLIPPAAWWGQSIIPAPKEQEHNAAEEKQEEKQESNQDKQQEEQSKAPEKSNTSNQTTTQQSSSSSKDNIVTIDPEIQTAYEWAYKHNITTISSLDDANPDWTVTRGHLAKMVVNYATNVLWREIPEEIPSECRWNDWRKDWESEEIKDYAVKSCALWLMWLDMPKFLPNLDVTRAQFGTIMSRLLWWKKYAWWTPYYRKHLNALKENNIMIQIQNPEKRIELRQWVWVMLMRSSENK